jgi:hypothetical protein
MRVLVFIALLLLLPTSVAAKPFKMNSGKTIEVLAVGPVHFSASPPALMLRYETRLPLTDIAGLRKEADEIWQHFVVDVERAKFESAVVQANSRPAGAIVKTSQSYGFVFTKRDGLWRTTESETTAASKLTDAMLRAFYDRWDWLLVNYNEHALSLCLDKDWRVTGTAPEGPVELKREAFLQALAQIRTQRSTASHHRDILSIKISTGENKAVVECRETTKRLTNGRLITLVEHTTDHIVLRTQNLLTTKTTTVVEKLDSADAPH